MNGHKWKFYRVGGVDQVVFRDGADIVNLPSLDQKLWVALACPVNGLEMDARTLGLIDTDKDGRIRAPEVIEAVGWINEVWKDPGFLLKGGTVLPLEAIRDDSPRWSVGIGGRSHDSTEYRESDSGRDRLGRCPGSEKDLRGNALQWRRSHRSEYGRRR